MACMTGSWNQRQIMQFVFQRGLLIDCLDVEESQFSTVVQQSYVALPTELSGRWEVEVV